MEAKTINSKQLDVLGNRSRSDREVFSSVLRHWGKRLGYCSVFAAVPAVLATQLADASSEAALKSEPTVVIEKERMEKRLNLMRSSPALLRRRSQFLLPHQSGNLNLLAAVAGNDDCPGRAIPGGIYTAAAPYTGSGDTTGANNTVSRAYYLHYVYYNWDTFGSDHVYSFIMTNRGPNAQIEVSTTSGTYKPLVYFLHGSIGGCPAGTANHAQNELLLYDTRWGGGNVAIFDNQSMAFLPLNVPLHLFIDSRTNDAAGSGPYTLRIQDVTIANTCANPIDCPEYFIQQHYFDFLNREPDPPGFAGWLALLNSCPSGDANCDRLNVSSAFFRSAEFQGRGYFLYRFYPVSFGRKPDYSEFQADMFRVSGFKTDTQLEAAKLEFISDFMSRTPFVVSFGALSNAEYVDRLLSTAGITNPNRDFWIAALGNGTRTRAQVLREIAESTEVYNKYYNQAFVVMQYFGYLRRQPDALYLNWIAHLDATGDYRSMTDGFINSLEYRARFGP